MMSTGGTRKGMSFCGNAAGEHATPVAPAAAATRKNVRRLTPWSSCGTRSSLVACPAIVDGRAVLVLRVLVTAQAPPHREGGHLPHHVHLLDLAVACLALELGIHDVSS